MRNFKIVASFKFFCKVVSVTQLIFIFFNVVQISRISADHFNRDEPRPVPRYKYSYHVRNTEGGQHGHNVHRKGPHIEGQYYVKLKEGATQNVDYYTDQFGYHPQIMYNNNADSAISNAKIIFGEDTDNYHQPFQKFDQSKNVPVMKVVATHTTPSTLMKFAQFPVNSEVIMNTGYKFDAPPDSFSSVQTSKTVLSEQNNSFVVGHNDVSIILPAPSAPDTYLQPELNEIANEFLSKMASVVPEMFSSTRLSRPIIVSENENISRKADTANATDDQSEDSADHLIDYSEIPISDLKPDLKDETSGKAGYKDIVNVNKTEGGVEVLIEPQNLEEQAVITTTLDITKSLPLTVNFVPDVDNNIQDSVNPAVPVQQVQFLNPPNTFVIPSPSTPLIFNAVGPRVEYINTNPYTGFHYIPIPVVQHQPNVIPLNFGHDVKTLHSPSLNNSEYQVKDTRMSAFQQPAEVLERRQVKYRSIGNQLQTMPQSQPQLQFWRRPQPAPYTTNVPLSNLIPYVKPVTNFHHNSQQILKTRSNSEISPLSHAVAHNIKYFPREAGVKSFSHKSAPFKPSHPLWDSIYPPSHMYYVPYLVFDKIPPSQDRKARDSSSKHNNRYLRRLYVEYGGFKPPMIPSTLLESEEKTERQEVPKEKL